jgi:hypothetical protein
MAGRSSGEMLSGGLDPATSPPKVLEWDGSQYTVTPLGGAQDCGPTTGVWVGPDDVWAFASISAMDRDDAKGGGRGRRAGVHYRDTREARALFAAAALAAGDAAAACAVVDQVVSSGTRGQKFVAWQALSRCGRTIDSEQLARALGIVK